MRGASLLLLLLLLLSATAMPALDISDAERRELLRDLSLWQREFGNDDRVRESMVGAVSQDHLLARLKASKEKVPELRVSNPYATFSHLTKFALLTNAEFTRYVSGPLLAASPTPEASAGIANATDAIDWTAGNTKTCVLPPKNQGACGSCWAFAATGVVASAHCIATGVLPDISDQHVTSCSTNDGSDGCNGGTVEGAIDWIVSQQQHLCSTSALPYTSGLSGDTGTCTATCNSSVSLAVGATINIAGESALEAQLRVQPVSVTVAGENDVWRLYLSGVISACPDVRSDHAVLAVGYGLDDDSGLPYFKVRNSWGANWGEGGDMRLERSVGGAGTCNVAASVSFPKIVRPTKPPTQTKTARPTTKSPLPTRRPRPPTPTPKPSTSHPLTVTLSPIVPESTDGSDVELDDDIVGAFWG
ncbi:hypothetical protein SPRG_04771 [Saprolegnia parasitica CBS 223.65]|uniref:Peptidase C1A papain C-terminal domain-containing protein n=1 Tax=Saprolegnia parasitica (strain CBS 223.65) TaxID=695850 RepID=A0A067CJF6_SAPPC|nr:hypothetical protein SPRG_04771 [Saprolegnia parasitica CBS 223.65]KDO30869.1 hypothetical protein SPRG_04771 [Saprolegnia parasitica CBS 223.65]|eukprot:XP_012198564.1 hypothetical protein SPRG_04771 [Saprolegnia parasitica CBS 223.65]